MYAYIHTYIHSLSICLTKATQMNNYHVKIENIILDKIIIIIIITIVIIETVLSPALLVEFLHQLINIRIAHLAYTNQIDLN